MPQKYFISAYTASQVLHTWDDISETAYFQALKADPRVIGIELPYLADRKIYPMEWLKKNIPDHWSLNLSLNWGRSAIETYSVDGPLQHVRQALAHRLLRGFVFSGCTADPESLYGAWKDRHAPPRSLCSESLLGEKEIEGVFNLIQSEELYLGIKVSNRFLPFDIKQSIALNLETIDNCQPHRNRQKE
ncbi:MAG: hypothetical protein A3F67_10615 [Verrucomicrobia bacterium RIFCSPHIGHO2_12_FULL_41_10]|nr:MAG: hypothetical protein A3F67_10615 [Verrucomicrobia bacterium RIFCSPHIGHO2_12_FULL_41_10]HLB34676.1 DUF4862 family protein [Chthoniobacterales bacterium]